ncbi:MAG: hypothetical protein EBS59_09010, partial [Verrucomicrobia bacterium]|nr:hypothetical protein [Verrucomicrobiota bacterium]
MQFTFNLNSILKFTSLNRALILLAVLCGFGGAQSFAATYTWNGAGANSLWSNPTNWGVGTLNWGNANDLAIFAGSTRTTTTNDLTANTEIVSILFQTNAAAFTLNGNALNLNTGVTNNSTNIQTINLAIAMTNNTAGITWAASSNDIVMNGVVSGTNSLTKTGTFDLILSGSNTYTGATTISNGALNLRNNTGLGTTAGGTTVSATGAALELQGGITVGAEALTLNGTGVSLGGALRNISGTNTYGGLVTLGSASRINSDSGTLSLTNTGTILGATFGLTVGGAGDTVLNSILGTTTGTLTKDGAGKLTLGGANTFTGLTTVSGGTLAYGVANALSSGAVTVNGSGAALDIGTFSDTVGAVTLTTGLITGTTGVLTGTSFAMSGDGDASAILGGSSVVLTKTGAGTTTTLSGANTYTGATTITSGALNIQNNTGLGTTAGGTTVSATGAALEL